MGGLRQLSGACICGLAFRIKYLTPGMPILPAMSRGWADFRHRWQDAAVSEQAPGNPDETVMVHVWTPTASLVSLNRGISRYVAAPDKHGVLSTGHAALELASDVYISHYPAVEIDRSGTEFARILRATKENDVEGVFQPSYEQESADWCPSTMQIAIPRLNTHAVRQFWEAYRQDTTYNLTNRNCSSVVAKALDMGMAGLFAAEIAARRGPLLHLIMTLQFQNSGFLPPRAAAMARTPGLVLDSARAFSQF